MLCSRLPSSSRVGPSTAARPSTGHADQRPRITDNGCPRELMPSKVTCEPTDEAAGGRGSLLFQLLHLMHVGCGRGAQRVQL
eukprot:3685617-Prymnesium_polylepis.1